MGKRIVSAVMCSVFFLSVAFATAADSGKKELVIVYTGDTNGHVEPCG